MNNEIFLGLSVLIIIAMFMVVLFHCLCYYTPIFANFGFGAPQKQIYYDIAQFLDSVDMHIFVFISAFLCSYFLLRCGKYRNKISFIKSKSQRLLVPYLTFGIAVYILEPGRYSWKAFIAGISHLWFLMMLFGCFIVMLLINHYLMKTNKLIDILLVISLYLLYYLFAIHPFDSYYLTMIKQVVRFLPIFILAFIYVKYKLDEIGRKFWILGLLICPLIIWLIVFNPSSNFTMIRFLGMVLSVSAFGFISSFKFENLKAQEKLLGALNAIDKNSMGIYLIHHLILGILLSFTFFREMLNNYDICAPFILFVFLIIVSYLISVLMNRNKYTKLLIG